jgi:UDP-3-O-[3-hydroxymyristoyl] glucosamine N-acyltransferase
VALGVGVMLGEGVALGRAVALGAGVALGAAVAVGAGTVVGAIAGDAVGAWASCGRPGSPGAQLESATAIRAASAARLERHDLIGCAFRIEQ